MNRYKPIGWRNESYRHSLASKGIRTFSARSSRSVSKSSRGDIYSDPKQIEFDESQGDDLTKYMSQTGEPKEFIAPVEDLIKSPVLPERLSKRKWYQRREEREVEKQKKIAEARGEPFMGKKSFDVEDKPMKRDLPKKDADLFLLKTKYADDPRVVTKKINIGDIDLGNSELKKTGEQSWLLVPPSKKRKALEEDKYQIDQDEAFEEYYKDMMENE